MGSYGYSYLKQSELTILFSLFLIILCSLAALIKHVSETRIQTIIDRLVAFTSSKDEGVRDIASLGLKTVVAEIAPGSGLASTACTKLAPKVVAQLESVRFIRLYRLRGRRGKAAHIFNH